MESKWLKEKDELNRLINIEKVSYEEIGRRYGCSGTNIKKAAKQIGIDLPIRNSNAGREPSNKGTAKKYYCLYCGKEIPSDGHSRKYCDSKCQSDHKYQQYIERWKQGLESGLKGQYSLSSHIRRYMLEKTNCKCSQCGWSEENPYTHTIPLEIDHIDGNYLNNKEENLRVLCPNCHSLTSTYKGANKGNGRDRTKYYASSVQNGNEQEDCQ